MKLWMQLAIIAGISLLCEGVSMVLPFDFPASVLALLVVFLLLHFKWMKLSHVQEMSDILLGNVTLLFIPVSAGLISYWDLLQPIIFPFVFICFATMALTYGATAGAVTLTIRWMNGRAKK